MGPAGPHPKHKKPRWLENLLQLISDFCVLCDRWTIRTWEKAHPISGPHAPITTVTTMNQALLYSKYNGLQKKDASYILENYFRLIRWRPDGDDRVLDIGCGDGDVTTRMLLPLLPASYKKLTGADLSVEMVEYAKGCNKNEKVDFLALDLEAKEIMVDLEEEYDHIFSFYCLHWIQDQRQALTNMNQMLKVGGDMLISFLASNPIFHIYENLASNEKWMDYMENCKKYISPYQNSKNPEKQFEKLLEETGFSIHLCKVVERKYYYPDVNVLRKSFAAVNPFIGKIPEDLHNDYLADFINEVRNLNYIENNDNNNEEKVRVPYKLFVIVASKKHNL